MHCGAWEIPNQGANYHVQLLGGGDSDCNSQSQLSTNTLASEVTKEGVESQGTGLMSNVGSTGVWVCLIRLGKG